MGTYDSRSSKTVRDERRRKKSGTKRYGNTSTEQDYKSVAPKKPLTDKEKYDAQMAKVEARKAAKRKSRLERAAASVKRHVTKHKGK